jgi:serine/threonine protein kinase
LKPENILLVAKESDVDIKISDFGLAKVLDHNSSGNGNVTSSQGEMIGSTKGTKTFCGTPQYFAPEVLQRSRTVAGHGSYSIEADMWSVGVVMYVLLAGSFPFSERTLMTMDYSKYNIKTGIWTNISPAAKDLVSKLLTIDPRKRLTARQALDHDWFSGMTRSTSLTGADDGNTTQVSDVPNLPAPASPTKKGRGKKATTNAATASGVVEAKDMLPPPSPATASAQQVNEANESTPTGTSKAAGAKRKRSVVASSNGAEATTVASAAAASTPVRQSPRKKAQTGASTTANNVGQTSLDKFFGKK